MQDAIRADIPFLQKGIYVDNASVSPVPTRVRLASERFNAIIVRYLKFAKSFNQKFPGFDTDIHGLGADETSRRSRYYVDCVAQK